MIQQRHYDGATNYLKLNRKDYKATHQNSWYIALSPFTYGAEFSSCFLNFEAWLMLTMEPQLVGFHKP